MKDYSLYIFDWEGTITSSANFGLSEKVLDLLELLKSKNKKLAVATGGSREPFDVVLEALKLKKYFDYTRTASECNAKPQPQMINDILAYTGIDKADAVMIGDTENDIRMAKNAGIDSIAVCQGYCSREVFELSEPSFTYDSIKDLYTDICS